VRKIAQQSARVQAEAGRRHVRVPSARSVRDRAYDQREGEKGEEWASMNAGAQRAKGDEMGGAGGVEC